MRASLAALAGALWLAAASSTAAPSIASPSIAAPSITGCMRAPDFVARGLEPADLPCPGVAQSAARLRSIARDLAPPPLPASWWERLMKWVRHWVGADADDLPGWLRFLPHWRLSAAWGRALLDGLVVLLLGAIAAVIIMELRAAGIIGSGGRRRGRARTSASGTAPGEARPLGPDEIDSAPADERPVLMLRLLVEALVRSRRLEHDRDLTCRELAASARFDTPTQRESFTRVAMLAERVMYGPRGAAPPVPAELLSGVRRLHAELLASSAAARESA